ncbi:HDL349Wp [Eremothecium sinecaudum]|uniref:HDL349Wp n=1 Tax=Eremothecium sinecaudum TaxID=45286 RepID=A0A0X8HS01_9SACH|nr:HDL349Wp [Eremothecium sinecaudum]AMD20395.1 HDL349Wp [Eremothecium sinecaudum]
MASDNKLDNDEVALYDRQIRLWGIAAQARIRDAKILLINFGPLGAEVAKNIVLSGVGLLRILDHHKVVEEDLGFQFFLSKEDVGEWRVKAAQSRLHEMNPRTKLEIDKEALDDKDKGYFSYFDLIVATDCTKTQLQKLNEITRSIGVPLYAAGLHGLFGYIFVDLIKFDATEERLHDVNTPDTQKKVLSDRRELIRVEKRRDEEEKKEYEVLTTRNTYKPFGKMLEEASLVGKLTNRQIKKLQNALPLMLASFSFDSKWDGVSLDDFKSAVKATCLKLGAVYENVTEEYIQAFLDQAGVDFVPVAAVVGGALSQDVINVLGKKQSPLNNFIVLDGITLDMQIFEL